MTARSFLPLLASLDLVVMERTGADTFLLHGTPPSWLRRVNARWKGEREVLASRTFPFLDHFLFDAEAFWATGDLGRVGSGLSAEPGPDSHELHYEAWAVTADDGQYLLIELRRDAEALRGMLQKAREGLLEHERLERTQRALERAQEELRRAKQGAEAAAAARAAMLSTISHEVRTPLHAIIGLTGLMLDSALPAAEARFLSLIRSSGETLLAVLDDVLDASRLDAGGHALDERAFDVRHVVDEALDVVALRADERGIDLNCQVDLAVPAAVIGDAVHLRQVLINLVSNAVKFTSEGDVLVVAEALDRDDGRVELHFAVKDEGPGIPADRLDALLSASAEPGLPGHGRRGLGLTICRALTERMGGRLWADSREGRGTTFHVTAQVMVAPGPPAAHLKVHQPLLDGRTIWVLGGSPATQQLLINQTRFWGMAPKATSSLNDVAGWRAGGLPDVVFLDRSRLAGVEGFESPPGVPVIELVTLVEAEAAARRPVAALLTKPVKCARLHALLVAQLAASVPPATT